MTIHDDDFNQALADMARAGEPRFEPGEAEVFVRGLTALNAAGVRYLVGGAFAKHAYTGVWRNTKDIDIFLKPADIKKALDVLTGAGFETEIEFKHWLAKARQEPYMIDLLFGTGHGHLHVDESWFEHSQPTEIAGVQTCLISLEDLIVSKVYVAERYRFDAADVLHVIQGAKGQVDWSRILAQLGDNRGLLLWYLILFDFVYPGHADYLPQALMSQLFEEIRQRWTEAQPDAKAFRGTLLDPFSYLVDIKDWGYEDRRNLASLVTEAGDAV